MNILKKLLPITLAIVAGLSISLVDADVRYYVASRLANPTVFNTAPGTSNVISAGTVDGADSSRVVIAGGGTNSDTRGGYCTFSGNESGGAGSVSCTAGNITNGGFSWDTGGSNRWQIPYSASATSTELTFGSSGYSGVGALIRATTNDGADDSCITLSGGGANAGTRGARISAGGNESGNCGNGVVTISTGGISGAGIRFSLQDETTTSGQFAGILDANFGATSKAQVKTVSSGALSGATFTFTSIIPAGAIVEGVVCRVTTLITGATSFSIGDGTDVDLWGATIAVSANTTTTHASWTANPAGTWSAAARNVVLTANGSNFTGGVVRCSAFYSTMTGPTA